MDDLLSEFLTETNESLSGLDDALLALERAADPETVALIFRLVHTIKGTCGFLGLPRLERVSHAAENVLGQVRTGALGVSPGVVNAVLAAVDAMRAIVGDLAATGTEPAGEDRLVIEALDALVASPAPDAAPAPDASATQPSTTTDAAGGTEPSRDAASLAIAAVSGQAGVAPAPAPAAARARTPRRGRGRGSSATAPALSAPALSAPALSAPALPAAAPPAADPPAANRPTADQAPPPDNADAAPEPADMSRQSQSATIRVAVDVLENLMTLVSELVLTRNQLLQIARTGGDALFDGPVQRLSQITTDLQEGVMKTRMQPIGAAWNKLPRLVRDLSRELGKPLQLRMLGAETEIDRQVLELVRDPLTHMVRNSADHGLEPPAERRAAGKPECGTITLNAYHEGGHITVQIEDDGRGLPIGRIRAKALAQGLAGEAELAAMDDAAVARFIFHPGFSTAAAVTAVSGRGVGMDVVKTNIERIGGTVIVSSRAGQGTQFVIRIPLTLAIVSALIVESRGERFAIAQSSVAELVLAHHVSAGSPARPGQTVIERIEQTPVLRLRDRLVPLVTLSELLQLDPAEPACAGQAGAGQLDASHVVVLSLGAASLGLVVDRVFDTEEIVVKPVAAVLREIPLFSGNTVLGDGAVIMILDANGIARAANVADEAAARDTVPADAARATGSEDETAILIVRAGSATPKAVPLSLVARLERVAAARIERSSGRLVTQYCGALIPLLPVDPAFDPSSREHHPVLVFSDDGRSVGLVVDEIVDVVHGRLVVQMASGEPGLLGTAVVEGAATELLDTAYFLSQARQDWFHQLHRRSEGKRLLVVEDSAFFRNMLIPALSSAGYRVTAVNSGDEALALLRRGEEFAAIVSDIEMPGLDGFGLVRAVRAEPAWQSLPLVALSGRAAPADIARGLEAGFTHYLAKFDREALLDRLRRCFEPDLQEAA